MKFAKWVYLIAGIYGLLIVTPLYFLEAKNGIDYPPPITHPEYYYGFIGVVLAWQVAFLMMARDPKRYRPLMLATMIEKYSYGLALFILFGQGRVTMTMLILGIIDTVLGTLFVLSYWKVGDVSRRDACV